MSSEQIEDVMSGLSEMGVNIVENEEADDEDGRAGAGSGLDEGAEAATRATDRALRRREEEGDGRPHRRSRPNVPSRMGAVELLSREGEIAIAKRSRPAATR
jgi:RNA polymerase primary sigma factor